MPDSTRCEWCGGPKEWDEPLYELDLLKRDLRRLTQLETDVRMAVSQWKAGKAMPLGAILDELVGETK